MNRRKAIQSVVGGAVVVAATVPEASAAGKDLESIQRRWQAAKTFTLQVADAMPADGYDFKPKPEMRSYGQLMNHLAMVNVYYISRFKGGEMPDELKPPKDTSKAVCQKYLAASFDYVADVYKGLTEADLDKTYPGRPNAPVMTGWDWMLYSFIHSAHHRGYAEVYLREKNITPPVYSV